MNIDWCSAHQLGVLYLDWLLYQSGDDDNGDYDALVDGLLTNFSKTSKNFFLPQQTQSPGLASRLICYRRARTDDEKLKKTLKDQMQRLLLSQGIEHNDHDFPTVQSELVPKPALVELIAAGPSDYDEVMFNRQALKIIQILYKSSANRHLGKCEVLYI